ncbi:MAG: thiamine phosphate synthase [Ancalomicrobiaceae bacterium]|nr:thiamine phosphate synthase [Ancalomicrobiaceae bacterium]
MTRIVLVSPAKIDLARFPAELEQALAGGDIASVLLAPQGISEMALQRMAEVLTPIAQRAGAAMLVADDTRAAGRSKADGVHVTQGVEALRDAVAALHPQRIVGAGNVTSRHEAMEMADAGADYVFFGLLDLADGIDAHPKSLEFAEWWVPLFEPPCVVMAGSDIASLRPIAKLEADFVALRDAIWNDPRGPKLAVEAAESLLAEVRLGARQEST